MKNHRANNNNVKRFTIRAKRLFYLLSVTDGELRWSSERRGRGGGSSGDSHRVQPQVQGWSFIWWWWALLLPLQFLRQLSVKLLHWLAALWSPDTASHTKGKYIEPAIQTLTCGHSVFMPGWIIYPSV